VGVACREGTCPRQMAAGGHSGGAGGARAAPAFFRSAARAAPPLPAGIGWGVLSLGVIKGKPTAVETARKFRPLKRRTAGRNPRKPASDRL